MQLGTGALLMHVCSVYFRVVSQGTGKWHVTDSLPPTEASPLILAIGSYMSFSFIVASLGNWY